MERSLRKLLAHGRFQRVPHARSRTMSLIRGRNNKSTELQFRMALVRGKIGGWTTNEPALPGKPDFYFKNRKLAIFIDGCFWHGCPVCGHIPKTNALFWKEKIRRNKLRDKRTQKSLSLQRIQVIRLWEHQIKNARTVAAMIDKIKGRKKIYSN